MTGEIRGETEMRGHIHKEVQSPGAGVLECVSLLVVE
jgi:hypothetical protein